MHFSLPKYKKRERRGKKAYSFKAISTPVKILLSLTVVLVGTGLVAVRTHTVAAGTSSYKSRYDINGKICQSGGSASGTANLSAAEQTKFDKGLGAIDGTLGTSYLVYKNLYDCCFEQMAANPFNVQGCNIAQQTPNDNSVNPWLTTSQGDVYLEFGTIARNKPNAGYFQSTPKAAQKSEYTYSSLQSEQANYFQGNPAESGSSSTANSLSYNNYLLFDFQSNSVAPPPLSGFDGWYDYLSKLVRVNSKVTTIATNNMSGNIGAALPGATDDTIKAGNTSAVSVFQTPSLTLAADSVCNVRAIILVDGNLTINPSFGLGTADTSNQNKVNACLFIVKGDVNITPGSAAASSTRSFSTTGTPVMRYDQLRLGIISQGNINMAVDPTDPIKIHGLLAGKAGDFQRDIASTESNNFPSVWIEYDPRYIEYFKQELKLLRFSTREKGFTASL